MQIDSNVVLAPWSTLGVGGVARWFIRATDEATVIEALNWAHANTVSVLVLGGGSNVVISDGNIDALVLQIAIGGVRRETEGSSGIFHVGAGEDWDRFVARTIDEGCAGLECLSGIPGLVGGTPVQNVGAYGQEVATVITEVRAIDSHSRTPVVFPVHDCGFAYRTSRFKHADAGRYIVTGVTFRLRSSGNPTITYADVVKHFERAGASEPTVADVRQAILEIRRKKGMVIEPDNPARQSVGSFFVNPIISASQFDRLRALVDRDGGREVPNYPLPGNETKVPAAWLIERAGFTRGREHGAVAISPFQAQAIINRGSARAADVLALAVDIKRAVWEKFGIALVPEPVFVGFQQSDELEWLMNPRP
jgi:UDP-N-acetylmuramate dehydrogenase